MGVGQAENGAGQPPYLPRQASQSSPDPQAIRPSAQRRHLQREQHAPMGKPGDAAMRLRRLA